MQRRLSGLLQRRNSGELGLSSDVMETGHEVEVSPDEIELGAKDISQAMKGMKMIMTTAGSRGDVQPMIALAAQLQKVGVQMLVLSNSNHVGFIEKFGLQAKGVSYDFEEFFKSPAAAKAVHEGDMAAFVEAQVVVHMKNLPSNFEKNLSAFREFKPDLCICALSDVSVGGFMSIVFEIPVVITSLAQVFFPSRYIQSMLQEPCGHYLVAWFFTLVMIKKHLVPMLDLILKEVNMDETIRKTIIERKSCIQALCFDFFNPLSPVIFGVSGALSPNPPDWTFPCHAAGFWAIPKKEQVKRLQRRDSKFGGKFAEQIQRFLSSGSAPVYIGWGSLTVGTPEGMMTLAARTLKQSGRRGIILGGWAKLNAKHLEGLPDKEELGQFLERNVLIVESAPHEWLFPQCAVTVHHGGAGTTVASLRSGRPAVVTPCFFDQFQYAKLVAKLGCGIAMPQFQKVTVNSLVAAIEQCCTSAAIKEKAAQIGDQLQKEDGLGTSVEIIDKFITEQMITGKWKANFIERKAKIEELIKGNSCMSGCCFCLRVVFTSKPFR